MQNKEEVSGFPLLFGYIGVLMILIGIITLLPLCTLLFYPQDLHEAKYFILPGISAIAIGYLMAFTIRGKKKGRLQKHQDAIIVVCCWILAIFITALPFVFSGKYNLTQGIFETTSGWSTTGLSVVDVTKTSHLFLMHRSTVLFFGGIGLVLVICSVLSDTYGMRLYHAEGHNDRLLPNLIKSARIIITIYFGYTLSGILLYICLGMPVFDAIIHSIGALSTGGFSSQPDSIGHYHSLSIEIVTIILMLLGNINFLAHLFLIKGKFRHFFQYCEVRFSILLITIATPIVAYLFANHFAQGLSDAFRIAVFQVVSALTTTGFQTISDFHSLPAGILAIMILLQLIGGGIGSTAGGIKQYRVFLALKAIWWQLKSQFYPDHFIYSHKIQKIDQKLEVKHEDIASNATYVLLYLMIFFLGSFLLSLYGHSLQDAMFEFSSALSTVGLSTGIMTYDAPSFVLWIGILGMFFGRLEIYVIIFAIMRCQKDIRLGLHKKKLI